MICLAGCKIKCSKLFLWRENNRWVLLVLALILILYFMFSSYFTVSLPVVGKHSWNEATNLQIQRYMVKNGPLETFSGYDPQHYEIFASHVFLWSSYSFYRFMDSLGLLDDFNFHICGRYFSLLSTLVSGILIYAIVKGTIGKKPISLISVVLFFFSPLVIFFGVRYQQEPFLLMLFFLSFYLLLQYIKKGNKLFLISSSILLGILIFDKISFLPFVLTFIILLNYKTNTLMLFKRKEFWLFISCCSISFLIPLVVIQVAHPEFSPFLYRIESYTGAAHLKPATATPYATNLAILFFNRSLLPTLGLLIVFPFLAFLTLKSSSRFQRAVLFSLFLPALLYFSITFKHNIIHMYHAYYWFLPVLLCFSLFFQNMCENKTFKEIMPRLSPTLKKIALRLLLILIILSMIAVESYSFQKTEDFYAIGTQKIFLGSDPHGNCYNVVAGRVIRELWRSIDMGNGENSWYTLVESPVPAYYADNPSITYSTYTWNEKKKEYSHYSFFENEFEFTNHLRSLKIGILTFTPGIYEKFAYSPNFCDYLKSNFYALGNIGVTSFYIQNELFETNYEAIYSTFENLTDPKNLKDLCPLCPPEIIDEMQTHISPWKKLKFDSSHNLLSFENFEPMFKHFEVEVRMPIIQVSTNSSVGPWSWIRSEEIPVLDSETCNSYIHEMEECVPVKYCSGGV